MVRNMWRKLINAATITALLTGTAAAQMPPISPFKATEKPPPTQDEIDKQKAVDEAYKSATKKIPEKKVDDPWATVRPTPPTASQNKKQQ
jgi:hypothetical protein